MAAELGILSLTQLQRVARQQQQLNSGNWSSNGHRPAVEDDGPWEVPALAKDIGGAMWPSRSYTCSFCNREFRSAQALGGHMNVHRRDRARLCQPPQGPDPSPPSTPTITFSSQEFDTGGGLCLFYPAPDTADLPPPSPRQGSPARDFLAGMGGNISHYNLKDGMAVEMLDLELRL